jgi:aldose sugar dehydrogenase
MINRYLRLLTCSLALAFPFISSAQNTVTVGETTLAVRDVLTGIDIPWEIIWGPDDHIWFTERVGRISRLNPETGERTVLLNITSTVHQVSESGLLGMVLHPDFPETPHLFVAYTYLAGFNNIRERIVRYTYDGDALVNPFTLLENIPGASTHNGCRLLILPDNTLVATTGDAQQPENFSQNLSSLAGKLLRMNLDGSIPADNPFGPDSYVYAYGFRNTQGLAFGPDGKLYGSEHGPNTNDEFNVIEPGKNYGWPLINGFCTLPAEQPYCEDWDNYSDPLTVWFTGSTIAPSDLIWYDHPSIPEWQDRFLMTVLKNKHVRAIRVDETDGTEVLEDVEYLNDEFGRLRDICIAPDGRVFLATNGPFWSNTQPNTHKIVELRNPDFDPVGLAALSPADVHLYPNPAADVLHLTLDRSLSGAKLTVVDALGRQMLSLSGASGELLTVDVSTLPAGLYALSVETSRGAMSKRFMIAR